MRERWVGRGLAAVVLVLGMFMMFLAQDGVVGTTPYGSTWSCGSLLAPKAIALPSPMETPADFADDLAAAQGACAEARDVRAAEIIRVGVNAALVSMTAFAFRRRSAPAPVESVRVAG